MSLWRHCNTYLPCPCLPSPQWFTVAISRSSGLNSTEIAGSANFFAKKKDRWANFSIAPFPPVWGSNCDFCLVKQRHVIYSLKAVCFISLLEVLGIIFTGCQSLFLSDIQWDKCERKSKQEPGDHKWLRVWVPALYFKLLHPLNSGRIRGLWKFPDGRD